VERQDRDRDPEGSPMLWNIADDGTQFMLTPYDEDGEPTAETGFIRYFGEGNTWDERDEYRPVALGAMEHIVFTNAHVGDVIVYPNGRKHIVMQPMLQA
jgi:hypothetical protein